MNLRTPSIALISLAVVGLPESVSRLTIKALPQGQKQLKSLDRCCLCREFLLVLLAVEMVEW